TLFILIQPQVPWLAYVWFVAALGWSIAYVSNPAMIVNKTLYSKYLDVVLYASIILSIIVPNVDPEIPNNMAFLLLSVFSLKVGEIGAANEVMDNDNTSINP